MDILQRIKEKYKDVVIKGNSIYARNVKVKIHISQGWFLLSVEVDKPAIICSHRLPESEAEVVFNTVCALVDASKDERSIRELYGLD